ncbi:MAG: mannose-6-phosphate isomerase [Acidobacteria bacterium]|nr:MAG: mannose-6-phosphate isomerase [Acidobacteriota bacterium]
MPLLYPFLVLPEFHERVWGTRDLRPYFTLAVDAEPIGEVWLTGENCKVANGPLAGQTLRDLAAQYGVEFIGEASPQATRFPLLIKFLFPRQKLSVQVHPDDALARRIGEPCGKTECWYVARAIDGGQVGVGLRPGINREMFRLAVEANQAEHMLNWLDVRSGEMIYVDAGTVHAVGPNVILVETQQNCDVTYRLYDYGRPRQLHLDLGMAAIKEKTHAGRVKPQTEDGHQLLVSSPRFLVEKYKVESPVTLTAEAGRSSLQAIVCLDGGAIVECEGSPPLPVMRGEAVVVPASLPVVSLHPQWSAEILRMRLPAQEVAEPVTTLHTSNGQHG